MKTKICNKCKKRKLLKYFNWREDAHRYQNECKLCFNVKSKLRYRKNRKKYRKTAKKYYDKNKNRILSQIKIYQKDNRIKIKNRKHKHYIKNKKRILLRNKKYYLKNKKIILKQHRKYHKYRYKTDEIFRLCCCLRNYLRKTIKYNYTICTILKYLGCSIGELKKYLEKQFQPGMSWNNHGTKWHIDHIIPLCTIKNVNDIKQIKKVCHYTNLRPLWAKDNLRKIAQDKKMAKAFKKG